MFFIQNFLDKMPYQFSGGQVRLRELSKMLIGKHKLILLDEPFTSIDLVIIEKLTEIFISLKIQNLSFLISDHNNGILDQIINL